MQTTVTRIEEPIDTERGPYTLVECGDAHAYFYDDGTTAVVDRVTHRRESVGDEKP